jgi:hypothetical protein
VVLPLAIAAMMPASHSSAPNEKGQGYKSQRPPGHEPEDGERDPSRPSEFVELLNEDHEGPPCVNVNNIYIAF